MSASLEGILQGAIWQGSHLSQRLPWSRSCPNTPLLAPLRLPGLGGTTGRFRRSEGSRTTVCLYLAPEFCRNPSRIRRQYWTNQVSNHQGSRSVHERFGGLKSRSSSDLMIPVRLLSNDFQLQLSRSGKSCPDGWFSDSECLSKL